MKRFKDFSIKEEIANVSSGIGVRGFGDVSGTPKVGDETEDNPHIERNIQGSAENNELVQTFVKSQLDDIYSFKDDNWWNKTREIKSYLKNTSKNSKHTLSEESAPVNATGAAVQGTSGTDPVVSKSAAKKWKEDNKLFTRIPPIETGIFAGMKTFKVPRNVFEKAYNEKSKGKHWRTYINDDSFHPSIREFANKNRHDPVIFEDQDRGWMLFARYGRKKRKNGPTQ